LIEARRVWETRRNQVRAALKRELLTGEDLEKELSNIMAAVGPKP
jgi:hypothetical protein